MPQTRNRPSQPHASYQSLEARRCLSLTASVGWDGVGLGEADLTYYVGTTPESIDQATFRSVIRQALSVWSEVVAVDFTETPFAGQRRSLDFTTGYMDGPGGKMAEAYFPDDLSPPIIAGDVQFEAMERWEVGNALGGAAYDLMYVAVHEIGHALGLTHLPRQDAVMGPMTLTDVVFDGLSDDDIRAIRKLYKARGSTGDPGGSGSSGGDDFFGVPLKSVDLPTNRGTGRGLRSLSLADNLSSNAPGESTQPDTTREAREEFFSDFGRNRRFASDQMTEAEYDLSIELDSLTAGFLT